MHVLFEIINILIRIRALRRTYNKQNKQNYYYTSIISNSLGWRSWQRVGLIILRSRVRSSHRAILQQLKNAPLAQLVAHRSYVPRVQGSSP